MTKFKFERFNDIRNMPSDLKRAVLERVFLKEWTAHFTHDDWTAHIKDSPFFGPGPNQHKIGHGIATVVRYIHTDALFIVAVRRHCPDILEGIAKRIGSGECRQSSVKTKTGYDIGVRVDWNANNSGTIFNTAINDGINGSSRELLLEALHEVIPPNKKLHRFAADYGVELPATTAPTPTQPTAQVKNMSVTKIEVSGDEAMRNMVSAGIAAVTNNAVSSIEDIANRFNYIAERNEVMDAQVKDLEKQLEKMRKQAQVPVAPVKTSYTASGMMPAFEVVMANAQDVFEMQSPMLNREIPTFEYEGGCSYVPDLNPHYQFRLSHLAKVTFALANNKRIFFTGHTGTGKTTLGEQICARTKQGFIRINFDGDIERADLIGTPEIKLENGEQVTSFQYGALPKAMKMPVMMFLDEVDTVRGGTSFTMQPILEGRPLRILENGGELIMPHEWNRIAGAGNTVGQGDVTGLYGAATQAQSAAQYDRWQMFVVVEYLSAEDEVRLAKDVVPNFDDGDGPWHLEHFIADYRSAFLRGELIMPISPRTTIAMAEMITDFREGMEFPDAFKLAVEATLLDKANPDDRAVIQGICDRRF